MIATAHGSCGCGLTVRGELDEDSREFVHRFAFPPGAAALVKSRATEVEGIRLLTFPPGDEWTVDCPLCQARIPLLKES
jgi:hypothetical protein